MLTLHFWKGEKEGTTNTLFPPNSPEGKGKKLAHTTINLPTNPAIAQCKIHTDIMLEIVASGEGKNWPTIPFSLPAPISAHYFSSNVWRERGGNNIFSLLRERQCCCLWIIEASKIVLRWKKRDKKAILFFPSMWMCGDEGSSINTIKCKWPPLLFLSPTHTLLSFPNCHHKKGGRWGGNGS